MFPNGWPGRGLLLLRVSNGLLVLYHTLSQWLGPAHSLSASLVASAISGLLLLFGIWTPMAGVLLAALEIFNLCHGTDHAEAAVLSAAIALSIAMLGPGVWSIDAALFGRQRLEFPED